MIQKFQPELNNILNWCENNRLKLNVGKSKSLIFGSRNKLAKVDYTCTKTLKIANQRMKFVNEYKYLGVTLDKEMTLSGQKRYKTFVDI